MLKQPSTGLYDPNAESSSCGVGFITSKKSVQTTEILNFAHQALCAVPHRGGMSSEGVGDGAGVSVDLSVKFFSELVGSDLTARHFGVGNFFLPNDSKAHKRAKEFVRAALGGAGFNTIFEREVPTDAKAINKQSEKYQLPIYQWVFLKDEGCTTQQFDRKIHNALLEIEAEAYTNNALAGFYPLSFSCRTQVLKGRLNSWEIIPYFCDLSHSSHEVSSLYFHTRFSTNTDPHPTMAQPFRLMAHNGELNTDKKNRLSETAVASAKNKSIIRPPGQSDSCRLDQTLTSRVYEEGLDLVTAVVSMMPPAWENDHRMDQSVRAMLEYFSLFEEKNDGPAAIVFGDGDVVGARLDRLGLRPLRTLETEDYLIVTSEAGQVDLDTEKVISRGRVEAGGMIFFDHRSNKVIKTEEALKSLALEKDYSALLRESCVALSEMEDGKHNLEQNEYSGDFDLSARYVAYNHNQESFKFLLDPMLLSGSEKVSAMGYGNAIHALSDAEGGIAKYFSQRFAQVTNPPLDSIREVEGMTLRVALGEKPYLGKSRSRQIVIDSPIVSRSDFEKLRSQSQTPCETFDILYTPVFSDPKLNETALIKAIDKTADHVVEFVQKAGGIVILSDLNIDTNLAPIPLLLAISAVNQKLIETGQRLKASIIVESGQLVSSHQVCCALGFGASAVHALLVECRAREIYSEDDQQKAIGNFKKAVEKALLKTMGKVGLCTVESYIGGEFFEPNFFDTSDKILNQYFPNMETPVGGVRFDKIAQSSAEWFEYSLTVEKPSDIPILGLFKERSEGAGHSFGTTAVREFVDLTEEAISFAPYDESLLVDGEDNPFRLMTLRSLEDAFGIDDSGYTNTSFGKLDKNTIDEFAITPGYRKFSQNMATERASRPAALRDVLALPADITFLDEVEDIKKEMMLFNRAGNIDFVIRGLNCVEIAPNVFKIELTGPKSKDIKRLDTLAQTLIERFSNDIVGHYMTKGTLHITAKGIAKDYLERLRPAPPKVPIEKVQPASEITARLASGAMSHGALVASAHEAVAHGTNMVGGLSNSGEGGEHLTRYGTIRASRIKQFASGRFGVWAGYLADPCLEEIEIKIGQGAKPGEGGQLPAAKVTVEIAAARGGTPGVELISPPPHHDTYSIEDLGQLIHDAKAARVKVIVKLVSSEGIGTIAVGVAKAGADVINVAGNTGGTGAAAVTSLKYTGRAAEIGIAEVHQALSLNGLRQKVLLRCSGAMQTGLDVVKASLLGADSFEFGTTALMMLKCVMAKNCNVKCPAGLTTNSEVFDGDPRALAQYLLNIAHEVREILSNIGFKSLDDARGRSDLLHLLDHPAAVGKLNLRRLLLPVDAKRVEDPVYMERDYQLDDTLFAQFKAQIETNRGEQVVLNPNITLTNRHKSVGGQFAIDLERFLNYGTRKSYHAVNVDDRGRRSLDPQTVKVVTNGSAGQSFGAFCNDGMILEHTGTCNDGVGKGACGGTIVVKSPSRDCRAHGDNVLVGNFGLFGATGGRAFIEGEAGDRFAVRNSGATAVVEGVGEFCAEYMTNGTVLNIGGFSKGFGNGMSGGFAYQLDPEGAIEEAVSQESVIVGRLGDCDEADSIHSESVRHLLEWHYAATKSDKAKKLLDCWSKQKCNIAWVMPRALLQYQDSSAILESKSRKELIDELANRLAMFQIMTLKKGWKENADIFEGRVPAIGSYQRSEDCRLLNAYTVLSTSQAIAIERIGDDSSQEFLDRATKNLILTEDFSVVSAITKMAKSALGDYEDAELSILISNSRLEDFKRTLAMRNVRSMDSLSTYSWIIHQDRKNRQAIGRIPDFDELFAKEAMQKLISQPPIERSSTNALYPH